MESPHITDLKDALSKVLLGSPHDDSAYTPEHMLVRKMSEVISAFDVGDITRSDLMTILKNNPIPGWSWDQWLSERVADGTYFESILEPDTDDQDEDD